jgi:hypothetical protein
MADECAAGGRIRIGRGSHVLKENLPQCHFSFTNFTLPDIGSNLGCHGGKSVFNHLSYGMAKYSFKPCRHEIKYAS